MNIAIANIGEVDAIWPRLAKDMQKACERSGQECDLTAGELWQMCRSGRGFLILLFDGQVIHMASVWQFQEKNGRPVFRCLMMYGTGLRAWVDDVRAWVSSIAKENGAKWLVATGRRGWRRFFKAVQCGDDYELEV